MQYVFFNNFYGTNRINSGTNTKNPAGFGSVQAVGVFLGQNNKPQWPSLDWQSRVSASTILTGH